MTQTSTFGSILRSVAEVALIGTALAVLAVPAYASAAMYAYVNQSGEVNMVEASSANAAISSAPMIHPRSGVMQLSSSSDGILDDNVSGI